MPTGQLPEINMLETLVAFARKHNLLVVHDNPYSFILNEHPLSLLSVPGAMERVLELNSLSKSQNMAGWRIGMLCAAKARIDEVLRFKSNMDSGMFLPVQLAAARALELGKDWYDTLNAIYRKRRDKAFAILDTLGCQYDPNQAGMFVWAAIPDGYANGFTLSDEVLHQANVFITPGGIFGDAGNRYLRISLCSPEERIEEAHARIHARIKNEK
jgi:aspartate/methionine/tyrosine aminotransferase